MILTSGPAQEQEAFDFFWWRSSPVRAPQFPGLSIWTASVPPRPLSFLIDAFKAQFTFNDAAHPLVLASGCASPSGTTT